MAVTASTQMTGKHIGLLCPEQGAQEYRHHRYLLSVLRGGASRTERWEPRPRELNSRAAAQCPTQFSNENPSPFPPRLWRVVLLRGKVQINICRAPRAFLSAVRISA